MSYIDWNPGLETNIEIIDDQHRELVDSIKILHTSIQTGTAAADIWQILTFLIDYADYHFKTEEEIMKNYNYPGKEQHMKEHDHFRNKVNSLMDSLCNENCSPYDELLDFLRNWFIAHIRFSDMELVKYCNNESVWETGNQ